MPRKKTASGYDFPDVPIDNRRISQEERELRRELAKLPESKFMQEDRLLRFIEGDGKGKKKGRGQRNADKVVKAIRLSRRRIQIEEDSNRLAKQWKKTIADLDREMCDVRMEVRVQRLHSKGDKVTKCVRIMEDSIRFYKLWQQAEEDLTENNKRLSLEMKKLRI